MTTACTALTELAQAIAEEHAVNSKAWESGFYATQPLSPLRIKELCDLGDDMIRAANRRQEAADRAGDAGRATRAG